VTPPRRTKLGERATTALTHDYITARGDRTQEVTDAARRAGSYVSGIGTPDDIRRHIRDFQDVGVDQVIFL
jgi:alkanesulfonate monooxygenase SsuD/methylene tetrahydromethanopterin reductase-like flavin-dependent oxidoreductase (luciferase family)